MRTAIDDPAQIVRIAGASRAAYDNVDWRGLDCPLVTRPVNLEPVHVDRWLVPGERLAALGSEAEVRHVPGHCPGNVAFYFAAQHAAFVGDALFNGSVGRTDIPGGDFGQLARAIRAQLYTLPDETVVLPGHGPETTIGDEKAGNPFVPA